MREIKREELIDFQIVHMDMVGDIYEYREKIIRIINKKFTKHTRRLLECGGLIEELVKNGLFIETWISDLYDVDADIILEHRKISTKQHYSQWSFEMMKDAAMLVLRINSLCSKYGYELKDCHQGNIIFDGIRPIWIDFGSIIKKQDKNSWIAQNEFIKCYYLPLILWSKGYDKMINSLYKSSTNIDFEEMVSVNFCIPPVLNSKVLSVIKNMYENLSVEKMYDKIKSLMVKKKTFWGKYQDSYWDKSNERFEYEIDWIIRQGENIKSMVEIGANQGVFSYFVAKRTGVKKIIATDYDQNAVDAMYKKLKHEKIEKITPIVMDFVWASSDILQNCQSELLVANALTHHLLLTQGMTIKAMVEKFSNLTSKYIMVEFMPKGVNKAYVPKWYTKEWFIKELNKKFEVIEVNNSVKGRVIIIGKKKSM